MNREIITSPIFYMGNKTKLIKKGLIELFPKNIDTFTDLFCGSGVVSLNVSANNIILNDLNENTVNLIRLFIQNNPDELVSYIEEKIDSYNLPTFSTDTRVYKGDRDIYKKSYSKLRDDYNKTRDVRLLYLLNIFSNSHMLRYNSHGEFNMPFGNGYFTDKCKENVLNNVYKEIQQITNYDFRMLKIDTLNKNDFVYLDPPYLNTTATYNENGGWCEKDEEDLYKLCEELSRKNICFGMSNVFENKNIKNEKLINWCEKNKWNVHTFDEFTYSACGKGNSKTKEVFITNY